MAERRALETVRLTTPITREAIAGLALGTVVFLDGLVFTGREGVYKKVIGDGHPLPEGLTDLTNVNFHCSPAAHVGADGSYRVGAVTATASFRFGKWLEPWLALSGCKMILGKGGMSERDYRSMFVPAGAIYLTTVGYGTGALLGRGITGVRAVHWLDELGIAQAMWVLEVSRFGPFIVESDLEGNSLFERNNRTLDQRIEGLYEGLKKPALSRFGETDDRREELI